MRMAMTRVSAMVAVMGGFALMGIGAACGPAGQGGGETGAGASPGTGAGQATGANPGTGASQGTGGVCQATGSSCSENEDCCNFRGGTGFCVDFGQGGLCADACNSGSDCQDGCCAQDNSGDGVCSPPSFCTAPKVPPGGSCSSDSQCDQSGCAAICVDWHEGNGAVCSCTCSWGTDCESGCCGSVNNGTEFACRSASGCTQLGGSCTAQYQCENNNCNAKTYCYDFSQSSGGECGCGCNTNADCESHCCVNYGQFNACGDPGSWQCNG